MTDQEIADAWIMARGEDGAVVAAITLDSLVRDDPDRAIKVLDLIIEQAKDESLLGLIGAGEVEELLSVYGPRFYDQISDRARKDPKWRYVFGHVWTAGFSDREVAAKVEALLDKYYPNGRP